MLSTLRRGRALASVLGVAMLTTTRSLGRVVVVGGGASGYMAAISAARTGLGEVVLLEGTKKPLKKVLASGGGRCNVMHDYTMAVSELVERYPRGRDELRGPYTAAFGPEAAREWFEAEGVSLKTEADGRVFPTTDDSQTIADALSGAARRGGVVVRTGDPVAAVAAVVGGGFDVTCGSGTLRCESLVLSTGSSPKGYALASSLGHEPLRPYPSLFSFRVRSDVLEGLAGLSLQDAELELALDGLKAQGAKRRPKNAQRGPLLVTHRGVSGPAALRLSAFMAADLKRLGYRGTMYLNSLPDAKPAAVRSALDAHKKKGVKQVVAAGSRPFETIPKRLWKRYVAFAGIPDDARWADVSAAKLDALAAACSRLPLTFDGKDTNKDEFVTAGGVNLKEIDFKTFGSKKVPGLHFTGELLNVDGVTGGFNFLHCWCSGFCAGTNSARVAADVARDADSDAARGA